jgi:hypothetical protein
MSKKTTHGIAARCAGVATMASLAAALGVFARGDGTTQVATSLRGEHFEVMTTGVYAFNAERVVAEGVG